MARARTQPRKTMERYGGPDGARKRIRQAHNDIQQGREDTDCRGQRSIPDSKRRKP